MIDIKANCIPKLGCDLPFVKQTRVFAFKKILWSELGFEKILLYGCGIIQIDDTLGLLFGGSCFSAPLWTLDENSTLPGKFSC